MTLFLADRKVELAPGDACGSCHAAATGAAEPIVNRPGLAKIAYRRGVHGTLLDSLLARIATYGSDGAGARTTDAPKLLRELLTTRELQDGAIALFDAWAAVADVVTFYQERLANEGFLRTAD
jgi:hypothetical protein